MNGGCLHSHTFQSLGRKVPAAHFTGEKTEAEGLDELSWLVTTLLLRPTAHPAVNPVPSEFILNPTTLLPVIVTVSPPAPPSLSQEHPWPGSASALQPFSTYQPEGPRNTVSSMCPSVAQNLRTPHPRERPPWPPNANSSTPPASILGFLLLSAVHNPGLRLRICCYVSPLGRKPLESKDLVCLCHTGSAQIICTIC